jgi:tetratricopeptide (TPR) repeat protein
MLADALSAAPLPVGSRLADRFLIVRAVGRGGMGFVYEALDEKVNRRVALKCAAPRHLHRLSPEARAAREVSHFNVCKVHDVHVVSTPAGEMDVLSMEFIEGETLSARVHRDGPLPPAAARAVARQICAGLAQAHRQGVIHGDLKAANVMLGRDADGGLRAVITDFGLAQLQHDADTGDRGGTQAYMAPELHRGERATVASDLFALGVLLHVMVSGHAPGPSVAGLSTVPAPIGTADSTRTRPPVLDAASVPRVSERVVLPMPARWRGTVARCLSEDPRDRPTSADEVARALEPRRWWIGAAAAVAAVAIAVAAYQQGRDVPLGPPVRLAVLPVAIASSLSGRPGLGGVATDVARRLTGRRSNFTVIPPGEAAANGVDTAERAFGVLGATHALELKLSAAGSDLGGAARLIDLESGRSTRTLEGTYARDDTPAMARAFAAIVSEAFRLPAPDRPEELSGEAGAAYAEGMALLRGSLDGGAAAMPLFERAMTLAPRSALPYAGLAEAQLQRFQSERGAWLDRAEGAIAKAQSLDADSVPVLIGASAVAQERGLYEDAIRFSSRAVELDSSNSEAWRLLAVSFERSNQPERAVATYERAIAAQPGYYRHYLSLGNFYLTRAQFDRAESTYRKVTEVAPDLQTGRMNLGIALAQQRRFAEAEKELLAALALRSSPGLLANIGALYYAEERYSDALPYFERSLSSGPPTVVRYMNLGDAFRHLNRPRDAVRAYEKARLLAEGDVALNPRRASARAFLGQSYAAVGDSSRAQSELTQALALEPENATVLRQAVITYELLGMRARALAVLERAPSLLLTELTEHPDCQSLAQDSRFAELVQRRQAR